MLLGPQVLLRFDGHLIIGPKRVIQNPALVHQLTARMCRTARVIIPAVLPECIASARQVMTATGRTKKMCDVSAGAFSGYKQPPQITA